MGLLKSTSTHDLAQYTSVKGPVTITVGPGVRAVQVRGCKPWVRLGDTLDDPIAAPGASSVLPPARDSPLAGLRDRLLRRALLGLRKQALRQ